MSRRHLSAKVDIREQPAYGIPEVSHYLKIPASTIRWWVTGRSYHIGTGPKRVPPIIEPPEVGSTILSFINLTEIHILMAIRRRYNIPFPKVQTAIQYLKRHFHSRHPLADAEFQTDGINLFVRQFENLINVSQEGQLAMRQLLEAHLERIERDPKGMPMRLYPFIRGKDSEGPKFVVIDPYMAFGQPSLKGTTITTSLIAGRFQAGESLEELAADYDRSQAEIEEAIRCELYHEAA